MFALNEYKPYIYLPKSSLDQSVGTVEYTDCIYAEE